MELGGSESSPRLHAAEGSWLRRNMEDKSSDVRVDGANIGKTECNLGETIPRALKLTCCSTSFATLMTLQAASTRRQDS